MMIRKLIIFVVWFAACAAIGWFGLGGMLERAKENGRQEVLAEQAAQEGE
jgi:hypothetical protein